MNKPYADSHPFARNGADPALIGQIADALWGASVDGWLVVNATWDIQAANPACERLFGAPTASLVGRNLRELVQGQFPPHETPRVSEAHPVVASRMDGKSTPASMQLVSVHDDRCAVIRIVDRTELQRAHETMRSLQEQLQHLQRNEVAARLVSGYVHDLNNQLTAIVGFSSLLRETISPQPEHIETVDCLLESSEHARALTQRLLSITRRRALVAGPEDINRTLSNMIPLAQRILGRNVTFVADIPNVPARVSVYPGHVEQTLWNLLLNAKEAMAAGGRIDLRALCEEHEGKPYCGFAVADTGSGIPKDLHDKIFTPFFTTKPQGSGLGLSVVKDLVSEQGGRLTLESEEGHGACFRVLWPAAPGDAAASQQVVAKPQRRQALLIDADANVRHVLERALASMGLEPLVPPPNVSRQWWLQAIPRPSFAIIDISNRGDDQSVREVRAEIPELAVIALSDPHHPIATPSDGGQILHLAKPFSLSDLGQKIREITENAPPPPGETPK